MEQPNLSKKRTRPVFLRISILLFLTFLLFFGYFYYLWLASIIVLSTLLVFILQIKYPIKMSILIPELFMINDAGTNENRILTLKNSFSHIESHQQDALRDFFLFKYRLFKLLITLFLLIILCISFFFLIPIGQGNSWTNAEKYSTLFISISFIIFIIYLFKNLIYNDQVRSNVELVKHILKKDWQEYILNKPVTTTSSNKIKWTGSIGDFGYIFQCLENHLYIDSPKDKNGDLILSSYAESLLDHFELQKKDGENISVSYLSKELSESTERHKNRIPMFKFPLNKLR